MRRAFLLAAAIIIGTAAQLARQEGLPATATLWAEDGEILWTDAYSGGVRSVFRGYAGYAIAGPRLVVLAVSWVDPQHLASLTAALAAVVVALLAVHVWFASAWFLGSHGRRAAAATFVVLLPAALFEVTGSLVNVQWFLMVNAALVLLEPSTRGWRTACDVAVALVAPVSAPLTMLLIPLAAVVLVRRAGRQRLVPAAFLAGAVAQAVAVSQTAQTASAGRASWDAVRLFVPRVVGRLAFGEVPFDRLHDVAPTVVVVAGVGLTIALFGHAAVRAREGTLAPAQLVTVAALYWIVPVALRGAAEMTVVNRNAQRYAVPAIALCFLALLTPGARVISRSAQRAQVGLLLAWVLLVLAPSIRGENLRSTGTPWRAALALQAPACAGGASTVDVPIHPGPETRTWVVRVPCARLGATSVAAAPGPAARGGAPSPPAMTRSAHVASAAPPPRPAPR